MNMFAHRACTQKNLDKHTVHTEIHKQAKIINMALLSLIQIYANNHLLCHAKTIKEKKIDRQTALSINPCQLETLEMDQLLDLRMIRMPVAPSLSPRYVLLDRDQWLLAVQGFDEDQFAK